MSKKKKSANKKNAGLIAAFVGVFVVIAGSAATMLHFANQNGKQILESIPETIPATTESTEAPEEFDPSSVKAGPVNGMTGKAKTLIEHCNADTVGWITVPNTKVDNPIVQVPDNEYYLDHGYDHKPFRAGTVFMDYRNNFGFDEKTQSDNILLYGHNMANNTMFGSLRRYRQDLEYYKEAPYIELESNYQHYTYVIFALTITDGSAAASWRYWDMEEFENQESFDAYVETARQKSLVQIPVDVQYGDKLVTLSTCYSDADDSRFLVIGRRLRDGESADTFASAFAQ